jgi:hypothetical protein
MVNEYSFCINFKYSITYFIWVLTKHTQHNPIPHFQIVRASEEGSLFLWGNSPHWVRVSSLPRLHEHTQQYHTRWDSSGREISPTQRPLPDNTALKTDIHAPSGIQTRNPSKRAATDPPLRPRGHWDRPNI